MQAPGGRHQQPDAELRLRSTADGRRQTTYNAAARRRSATTTAGRSTATAWCSRASVSNYTFDSERSMQVRGGVGLFQAPRPKSGCPTRSPTPGFGYVDYNLSSGLTGPLQIRRTVVASSPTRTATRVVPSGQRAGTSRSTSSIRPSVASVWKANLAFEHELPWWGVVGSADAGVDLGQGRSLLRATDLGGPPRLARMAARSTGMPPAVIGQLEPVRFAAVRLAREGASQRATRLQRRAHRASPTRASRSSSRSRSTAVQRSDFTWSATHYTNANEASR